nr:E3 ubiquitin-protein ligase RLIM-like [Aegilops tauschii subsp. strangulata]
MPPVEFIIGLGFYASALGCFAFTCRLVYLIYSIVSTRLNNNNSFSSSSSSSSSSDDDGSSWSDEESNCYDEEQGVIPDSNDEERGVIPDSNDEERGLISEGESDGTGTSTTGGERCCICLEQMTDGGSMWQRLRVALRMERATRDPDKRRRRLPRCGHVFHAGCIDEWLKRSLTCPSCRRAAAPGGLLDDPDVILRIIILCYFLNYCLS